MSPAVQCALRAALLFLVPALALCAEAAGADVATVASYAAGPGIEGIAETQDGALYLTSNFDSSLLKLTADGKTEVFARLPAHPQVVVDGPEGLIVTAHGKLPDFKAGPPISFTNLDTQVLVVDKTGAVLRSLPGASTAFFNGLARAHHTYLIADSAGGTIWQLDLAAGQIRPWLRHEQLQPASVGGFPGANGIQVGGGWVYIANTTRGSVYRIAIDAKDAPVGTLQPVAQIKGADDFALTSKGTIFIPSGTQLLRISARGEVSSVADLAVNAPLAFLRRDGRTILVPSRAPFPGSAPKPTRLLKVEVAD